MKHSTYTSYDELPLMLSVAEVASVLGIPLPRAQNWQPDRCSEGQVPRMDRRKQRFQKRTAVDKEESLTPQPQLTPQTKSQQSR